MAWCTGLLNLLISFIYKSLVWSLERRLAQPPTLRGLRGKGLVWLIGTVLAANRVSNCSLTRAMDGRIVRCGIINSCQIAATSKVVKALLVLSLSHVTSVIASAGLYLYL